MGLEGIVINQEKHYSEVMQNQLEQLNNILKKLQPTLNKICLSTADGFEFINPKDIIYCKANGSYTNFIFKNRKSLLVSKHLKEYENLLIKQYFMRVHNSFLINLNEVRKFIKSDGGYIIMNNEDCISISKKKKEEFLNFMGICKNHFLS